jgi:hypothetical protein
MFRVDRPHGMQHRRKKVRLVKLSRLDCFHHKRSRLRIALCRLIYLLFHNSVELSYPLRLTAFIGGD